MKYSKHCLTCDHWLGDKAKQIEEIKKHGDICMDINNGFPLEGHCKEIFDLTRLDIDGDAYIEFLIDANFGCILHT